jgi:hypothetical protein
VLAAEEQASRERFEQVRGTLRDWRARAQVAETLVVSLLSQLCGGVGCEPVYLRSMTGAGLRELDKAAVNAVLARAGLQLRSKANASSRTVAVTVAPGQVVPHSVFWLAEAPKPGVAAPEDDAAAEAGRG